MTGEREEVLGRVGIPAKKRSRLHAALDSVESGGNQPRVNEIRIGVATGKSALDPKGRTVPHDAIAHRAVVVAPGDAGGRKASLSIALVRIDRGREEERQRGRVLDQPSNRVPKGLGGPDR